tara:strand:+ start:18 stop:1286 length:1269 start_codon:yes stop_codon:yes gene_type:complete
MTTKITEKNIDNIKNVSVDWQSVVVGDGSTTLTATAGKGYFLDTTSGTQAITLPSVDNSTVGDTIKFKDYARTWNSNSVTINAGALLDGSTTTTVEFDTQGQTISVVFMDSTKGWSVINEDTTSKLEIAASFIAATGGSVTTSGDFKIHSFTGDGCFVVSSIGNVSETPSGGPKIADYLVIAGGGAGGASHGGGGGAGGYRESKAANSPTHTPSPHTASPLAATTGVTLTASTFPITVGAGGTGGPNADGTNGSNSIFSTITAAGGGKGGSNTPTDPHKVGNPGGSGGGAKTCGYSAGTGNTPPVSPPQGNNGGAGGPGAQGAGGGGGAGAVGSNSSGTNGGVGGNGVASGITGSCVTRAGGGGGQGGGGGSAGGTGGGGTGVPGQPSVGTANTGGGGGGNTYSSPTTNGGKGIVIIRYKFQ